MGIEHNSRRLFCSFYFLPRTILLSVISLLNEPNTFSAANVDASVLYRKWRDSRGKDKQYIELIKSVRSMTRV